MKYSKTIIWPLPQADDGDVLDGISLTGEVEDPVEIKDMEHNKIYFDSDNKAEPDLELREPGFFNKHETFWSKNLLALGGQFIPPG